MPKKRSIFKFPLPDKKHNFYEVNLPESLLQVLVIKSFEESGVVIGVLDIGTGGVWKLLE